MPLKRRLPTQLLEYLLCWTFQCLSRSKPNLTQGWQLISWLVEYGLFEDEDQWCVVQVFFGGDQSLYPPTSSLPTKAFNTFTCLPTRAIHPSSALPTRAYHLSTPLPTWAYLSSTSLRVRVIHPSLSHTSAIHPYSLEPSIPLHSYPQEPAIPLHCSPPESPTTYNVSCKSLLFTFKVTHQKKKKNLSLPSVYFVTPPKAYCAFTQQEPYESPIVPSIL